VKVGGSLLGLTDWPDRLADLVAQLNAQAPQPLLVVGGGHVVDGLREIDAASPRPTPPVAADRPSARAPAGTGRSAKT
jgi:hypothetical protein